MSAYNEMRRIRLDRLKNRRAFLGNLAPMSTQPTRITRLLDAIHDGQEGAGAHLVTALYGPLRRMARDFMRTERREHTLQPTALVHEAWFRLVGERHARWENRAHFFAAAAEAMRQILIDHARRRNAAKRGGGVPHVALDEERDDGAITLALEEPLENLEALDAALRKMEADERHGPKCSVAKLRCFAGLTIEETAKVLNKSVATVKRDWIFAKAWLYREMTKSE